VWLQQLCLQGTMTIVDSLHWFSQRPSPTPHFWGVPPGAKFAFGRDLCTMHRPQVPSSYVYSFGSYDVDKQTHKQRDTQTNRCHWKHPTLFAMLQRWV